MNRQFFSGNTLEQAVLSAARHFDVEPERVAYKVRDKKHGFLKIRRRVLIEVDPEAPERPPDAALPLRDVARDRATVVPATEQVVSRVTPGPPQPSRGRSREDWPEPDAPPSYSDQDAVDGTGEEWEEEEEWPDLEAAPASDSEAVERAVREILRFLRLRAEVLVRRGDQVFEVELSDSDQEVLTANEGRLLHAMDHLIPRLVRSLSGQGVPCKVDYEGYRASYEDGLRELAAEVAEKVRREGIDQRLRPMNPADRRIVHLALVDHPDVETESEGEGHYKRVRISAVAPASDPFHVEPA